jgi:hypothetical protein
MNPNPELQGLHEILLPDPVSWLPQTAGWYLLLGMALLALVWWGCGRLRHFTANRYRRLALAELAALEQQIQAPGRRAQVLPRVPVLLKRTALSAFPRVEVAGLSGREWLTFLDRTLGGTGFTQGPGRLLRDLAYLPPSRVEELSQDTVSDLLELARGWIQGHVRPHS